MITRVAEVFIDVLIVFDGDDVTISEQVAICSKHETSEVSDVLDVCFGDDAAIEDQLTIDRAVGLHYYRCNRVSKQ